MLSYIKKILFLLGSDKNRLFPLFFLFILNSLVDLIGIGFIFPYLSFVLSPEDSSNLINVFFKNYLSINISIKQMLFFSSVFYVIIFAIKAIITIISNYLIAKTIINCENSLRFNLMLKYQRLKYKDFINKEFPDLINLISEKTHSFSQYLSNLLKGLSETIILLLLVFFIMWKYFDFIFLILISITFVIFFYDKVFKSKLEEYGKKNIFYTTRIYESINNSFKGFKELKVNYFDKFFFESLVKYSKKRSNIYIKTSVINSLTRPILEIILIVTLVTIVFYNINLYGFSFKNTFPSLSLFAVASLRLLPTINVIITTIQKSRIQMKNISDIYYSLFEEKIKVEDNTKIDLEKFNVIRLDNISFKYENSNNHIFENLNVKILSGSRIAILGSSGIGKTTFIDILIGILDPTNGVVSINNMQNTKLWKTKFMYYIPQKVFLIRGSLKENITFGTSTFDNKLYEKVLEITGINKIILQNEENKDVEIMEDGTNLSGGQKQRISLARALYNQKQILIIDEGTNSLDLKSEREILESIFLNFPNITILFVTHREANIDIFKEKYIFQKNDLKIL